MALKNINEIQTNDYRYQDQSFLKETLSALANSGQRFSAQVGGIMPTYFTISDCFDSAIPAVSSYSYIQCSAHIHSSDIQAYRDIYGTDVTNTTYSYFNYNYIYKENDGSWSSELIGSQRQDILFSSADLYNNDDILYFVIVNTGTVDNNTNNYDSVYIHNLINFTTSLVYTDKYEEINSCNSYYIYDNNPTLTGDFSYIYLWIPEFPKNTGTTYTYNGNKVNHLVTVFNDASYWIESVSTTSEQTKDLLKKYVSDYNIYILTYFNTEKVYDDYNNSLSSVFNKSIKNNSGGYNILNTLFKTNLSITPSNQISTESSQLLVLNKKDTGDVEYVIMRYDNGNYYDDTTLSPELETLLSPVKDTISDIILNKDDILYTLFTNSLLVEHTTTTTFEYEPLIYNKSKNVHNKLLNTLINNITGDYISEYISNSNIISNTDWIEVNSYFNTNFVFNVYTSSLNHSCIYCTSSDIQAEYCQTPIISNAIEKKIICADKTDQFIVDWTDKYNNTDTDIDTDYSSFDIYNKIVLFNIKVNYPESQYTDGNLFVINPSDIIVYSKYILPYINTDNYWCINGIQTGILAKGLDSSQLSVIMLYSDDGITAEVKTSIHKNDICNYISFCETVISIDKNNKDSYTISTPVIDLSLINSNEDTSVDILKLLKSALIVSIVKATGDISTIIENGYITTFWIYNEDTNSFVVISDNTGNALDLSTMAAVNAISSINVAKFNETPGKYKHDQLILSTDFTVEGNTPIEANENGNIQSEILGAIQNIGVMSIDNADEYGLLPYDYDYNVLTSVIGFFDEKEYESNSQKYVDKSIKYGKDSKLAIKFDNDNKITSANLYKYIIDDEGNYGFELTNDSVPVYNSTGGISGKTDVSYQASVLDTSSMFVNHTNVLNRINILSLGGDTNKKNFYYSYIGTSYEDSDKSTLVIGTSIRNVDVSRHLVRPEDTDKFTQQTSIDVNFDQINLNGHVHIGEADISWTKLGNTENYYYANVVVDTTNTKFIKLNNELTPKSFSPYLSKLYTVSPQFTISYYEVNITGVLTDLYKQKMSSDNEQYIKLLDYIISDNDITINPGILRRFQNVTCIVEYDKETSSYMLKDAVANTTSYSTINW